MDGRAGAGAAGATSKRLPSSARRGKYVNCDFPPYCHALAPSRPRLVLRDAPQAARSLWQGQLELGASALNLRLCTDERPAPTRVSRVRLRALALGPYRHRLSQNFAFNGLGARPAIGRARSLVGQRGSDPWACAVHLHVIRAARCALLQGAPTRVATFRIVLMQRITTLASVAILTLFALIEVQGPRWSQ